MALRDSGDSNGDSLLSGQGGSGGDVSPLDQHASGPELPLDFRHGGAVVVVLVVVIGNFDLVVAAADEASKPESGASAEPL